MSANNSLPHIFVLPEDDADRQLATGFHLEVNWDRQRRLQVLEEAGGWPKVVKLFKSDHIGKMRRYPERLMVLLIDFDDKQDRFDKVWQDRFDKVWKEIPDDLKDRVFILGARKDPEALTRAKLGSLETIGKALARDCREDTDMTWGHDLLKHNAGELERLRERVRPILF